VYAWRLNKIRKEEQSSITKKKKYAMITLERLNRWSAEVL